MSWNPQPYNPANQWGYNPPGPGPPGARSAPPGYQPYNPGAVPTQSLPPGGYSQRPPPTSSLPPSGGYSQARPPPYTPQSLGYSQRPPPTSSYGGGYGYGQPPPPQPYGRAPTQPPPGVDPELWGWFQAVDADNSGKITAVELQQALLNNNWSHFNAETCRLLIGMFDRNKDGTIDAQEFAALWKYVQEWKQCFDRFDKDKSGNIDSNELQQALNSFGYRLSTNFCQMCTRLFDRSDMRTMKFDDFIQCCVMLRALTESFKRKDTDRSGIITVSYEQFLEMAIDNTM